MNLVKHIKSHLVVMVTSVCGLSVLFLIVFCISYYPEHECSGCLQLSPDLTFKFCVLWQQLYRSSFYQNLTVCLMLRKATHIPGSHCTRSKIERDDCFETFAMIGRFL